MTNLWVLPWAVPWTVPVLLVAAVALLAARRRGARLFPGRLAVWESFWCPFRHDAVRVGFRETQWDGRRVDVESCSLFTPPGEVRCEKACLTLAALPQRAAAIAGPTAGDGLCACWRVGLPSGLVQSPPR